MNAHPNRRQDDEMLIEMDKRLSAHEAVCAERYETIGSRLTRIEAIMMFVAGTLICSMAAIIFSNISH
jgi:hypothetical protein